jgi:hypothetical protein
LNHIKKIKKDHIIHIKITRILILHKNGVVEPKNPAALARTGCSPPLHGDSEKELLPVARDCLSW